VAAANERDENLLDEFLMADDDSSHLRFDFIERVPCALNAFFNLRNGFHDVAPHPSPAFGRKLSA
jgi:hypothetical protein